jgi:hypothetical protein
MTRLCPLELSDRPEHRHRELVLRKINVVLALNDDPLPALQEFGDDDALVGNIAGDAIGVEKVNGVICVRLCVGTQLVKAGTIEQCAAVAIVYVLFDEPVRARRRSISLDTFKLHVVFLRA